MRVVLFAAAATAAADDDGGGGGCSASAFVSGSCSVPVAQAHGNGTRDKESDLVQAQLSSQYALLASVRRIYT